MAEETQTYNGGCHCGAVTYTFTSAPITEALQCNCSHCQIKGLLLVFIPRAQFTLVSGEDAQQTYTFNTGKITHRFCTTCGVESYALGSDQSGNETAAINVRCVKEIDLDAIKLNPFNGKDY